MFTSENIAEHVENVATNVESVTSVAVNSTVESVNASLSMFQQLQEKGISLLLEYGPKIIVASLILWISLKIINFICRRLDKLLTRRNVDTSLRPFIVSVTSIGLKILVALSVISIIGIPMTSFITLIGAMGLAIGMAFSGTLSNVAGGVVLLILRPFKVGDTIMAQTFEGTVKSIQIFNTILVTGDNKTVIIPNGALATGNIINYSTMENRRIDINIKLAHGEDIIPIQKALIEIAKEDKRVFSEPEPTIIVTVSETSVILGLRFWLKNSDYWDVNGDLNEKIYHYLREYNVGMPYQKVNFIQK
ncbi:MAG: mscS [Bacteroidetes bacterium]|nr:mscS [Bacteroidota bacterium]